MPFRPTLPGKAGYIEVEVNGIRTYRNVLSGLLFDDENLMSTTPDERIAALEETKADRADVDAIAKAIEKGLSL